MPHGVLHGPTYGRPELGAGLAQPAADVDDRGDGGGGEGEGEVLPRDAAAGAEGDDGEVNVEGHPLVRRGGPRELRRRLEQAREALREAVREVLAVPLHALPRLEGDLHARRVTTASASLGFGKSGFRGESELARRGEESAMERGKEAAGRCDV